jgi:hypothetical protein
VKRTLVSIALIALSSVTARAEHPPGLTADVKAKVTALADQQSSDFSAILLPEQAIPESVQVASLPEAVRTNAVAWIRKVVQSKWLPSDIEAKFLAAKDLKLSEKKDAHGVVFSEYKGDFLLLDHQVEGYAIHIAEYGHVSVRVDFPTQVSISNDPSAFIKKWLAELLNVPPTARDTLDIHAAYSPPFYTVLLHGGPLTPTRPASKEGYIWNDTSWWERLTVCTDGRFFFVQVPELEPGYYNPQAKPGLPDRF